MIAYLQGDTQNAYYDALDFVKWYGLPDNAKAKADNAEAILVRLLKYSGGKTNEFLNAEHRDIQKIYLKADEIYTREQSSKLSPERVLKVIDAANPRSLTEKVIKLRDQWKATLDRQHSLEEQYRNYDTLLLLATRPGIESVESLKHTIQSFFGFLVSEPVAATTMSAGQFEEILAEVPWDSLAMVAPDVFEVTFKEEVYPVDSLLRSLATVRLAEFNNHRLSIETKLYAATMADIEKLKALFPELAVQENQVASTLRSDNKYMHLYAHTTREAEPQASTYKAGAHGMQDMNFPTQTEIIDAIAVYLARRTKEEAALFLIESLNKVLRSDELAKDLFPQTAKLMQTQEASTSPKFGAKWRNAIATDYINLPQNIARSPFIESRFSNTENKKYFNDAVTFAGYVSKKYSFIDIARTLFADPAKLQGKWSSIGVNALHIINQELYDTLTHNYWISPQEFFQLDTTQLRCLYDLIRIKYRGKVSDKARSMFDRPAELKSRIVQVGRSYTELLTMLQQFFAAQQAARSNEAAGAKDGFWDTQRNLVDFLLTQPMVQLMPKERKAIELFQKGFLVYDYISNKNFIAAADNVLDVIAALTSGTPKQLINLTAKELATYQADASRVYELIQKSNNGFQNILLINTIREQVPLDDSLREETISSRLDYGGTQKAMVASIFKERPVLSPSEFSAALREAFRHHSKELDESYRQFLYTHGELSRSARSNIADLNGKLLYPKSKHLTDNLAHVSRATSLQNTSYFKWLTNFSELLTEIAGTRDGESLANVIEAYALPTGSYRLKRNSGFSLDLNAYAGAYYGQERIDGQNSYRSVYGITAPVGLAFSIGTAKGNKVAQHEDRTFLNRKGKIKRRTQSSWTIDLTVIDVGAILSYRFGNSESSEQGLPKEVKWSQVISPGVNLRYGLKGTPLCFGIGAQKSAELRTIKDEQKGALRFHFTAAFDLPLINIYRSR
jgi:hypothetical protein